METKKKNTLAAVGLLGIVAGGILLATRGKGDVSMNENMTLTVTPAERSSYRRGGRVGYSVRSVGPNTLVAGVPGNIVSVTLNNNSVYTGSATPAPYTFVVVYGVLVGPLKTETVSMGAGETGRVLSYTFTVPVSWTITTWQAQAQLYQTNGTTPIGTMLTASGPIQLATIVPGGSLSW